MDDRAGADEVDAFRRDEAGWEDVEVICYGIVDDGVAGIYMELLEVESWNK